MNLWMSDKNGQSLMVLPKAGQTWFEQAKNGKG